MPVVTINNKEVSIPDGITLIQACEIAGVEIPRFCYHERLEIAGNCRMCLVEIEGGPPKPVASCSMPANDGMKVHTNTEMVKKAREGVMEFLLANHPLDCPICDQAGECDLQDQSMLYGTRNSRFEEDKRSVVDKNIGPLVKTTMTRCIHCTRCVRFITDVAGVPEMGAINRGEDVEITTYLEKSLTSELSGNIIDLCPVGALTSKPYAFKARSWELKKTNSIDVMDAVGSNIRIDSRGLEVMRIVPRINEEINEEWISDKARFSYDGLKNQRLDKAYIRRDGKLIHTTLKEAYMFVAKHLSGLKGNEIGALVGDLAAVEDIFSLKSFVDHLGSDNIDCRPINSKISNKDRALYTFNTTIAGIEEADSCLIVGCNPRVDAPIINARIRKRYLTGKLHIASIGVDSDLTYSYENIGNDINILSYILKGESQYSEILKSSKKPMIIIGSSIFERQDSELILDHIVKISDIYGVVTHDWNGFNILHKTAAIVGALDIGFVSKDNSINTRSIIEGATSGKIKALYLLGFDNIDKEDLKKSFVIYQGSHGDVGAHLADVILPAAAYTEKDAIYVNNEGRPQTTSRAIFPIGDAKEDWKLIYELAKTMNISLGFNSLRSLRDKIIENNKIFENLNGAIRNNWVLVKNVLEDLKSSKIKTKNIDYYQTNVIAKNSRTMVRCSDDISSCNS